MRGVKITLAVGLGLLAVAVAFTLTRAPITVARAVNATKEANLGSLNRKAELCQANETIPRGTTAIRLHAFSYVGPRVALRALAGGRVIASGEQGSGWTGGAVTIPIPRLSRTRSGVTLCFTLFLNGYETANITGRETAKGRVTLGHGASLPGRVGLEYLRPGRSSWWSLAPSVARHMGLGTAGGGYWNAALVVLLMVGVGVAASRLLLRELR